MGCDPDTGKPWSDTEDFNPRTPCGVRHPLAAIFFFRLISIHAPRVGCDHLLAAPVDGLSISIHAPRVGCDARPIIAGIHGPLISIHAPRVGCDGPGPPERSSLWGFQSTHPVWGATVLATASPGESIFQSTHPVWGATTDERGGKKERAISIHAPRVGCDRTGRRVCVEIDISIHAPRVGCDNEKPKTVTRRKDFNPRTPCGVRRSSKSLWLAIVEFQSTHPVWGATAHSPPVQLAYPNFNPRTPCGVRLVCCSGLPPS